ncbi:toll/interleukin-1 receptor domain-containing protein [Leucobacter insecticola]|uniref:toll/interleukin-1 receptor domain-containing protein n=1 Tax=Leucobacter insecticola TaxID=2714934 RepID=UPI00197EBE97|nr:toll/interleukin-1 receptor domain-containing protein [Leucobacter insecticola]
MGLKATSIRHSATVEPPPLPTAKSAPLMSLSGIQHERPPIIPDDDGETWDVFISHASEDKQAVAEPLALELRNRGLKVWLDKTELRIGDSLRRKIDFGLAHSTFGVVVLSRSFFAKGWPQYELDGIIGMSVNGDQRMLPIWHEISRDEIAARSPSLVDKIARNTAIHTVAEIAEEIADVVQDVGN